MLLTLSSQKLDVEQKLRIEAVASKSVSGVERFEAVLAKHRGVPLTPEARQEELAQWLRYLDDLYQQLEKYLAAYIGPDGVDIVTESISLREPGIGLYEAPTRVVWIGDTQISFEPIGTMLIGTKGRVDVVGPMNRRRLTLVDRKVLNARSLVSVKVRMPGEPLVVKADQKLNEIDWTWKIVTRPPEIRFIDFEKDTFLALIAEVADAQ